MTVNTYTVAMADAMGQQCDATASISGNVNAAAEATGSVLGIVDRVASAADATARSASRGRTAPRCGTRDRGARGPRGPLPRSRHGCLSRLTHRMTRSCGHRGVAAFSLFTQNENKRPLPLGLKVL